jgi:hypothetical protein
VLFVHNWQNLSQFHLKYGVAPRGVKKFNKLFFWERNSKIRPNESLKTLQLIVLLMVKAPFVEGLFRNIFQLSFKLILQSRQSHVTKLFTRAKLIIMSR